MSDGRRMAAETNVSNGAAPESASNKLVLAAKRTYRRDPSDGFNYYNGGWNFSDPHYVYVSPLSHVCFIVPFSFLLFFVLICTYLFVGHCE